MSSVFIFEERGGVGDQGGDGEEEKVKVLEVFPTLVGYEKLRIEPYGGGRLI